MLAFSTKYQPLLRESRSDQSNQGCIELRVPKTAKMQFAYNYHKLYTFNRLLYRLRFFVDCAL
jgi:hypothetical protein